MATRPQPQGTTPLDKIVPTIVALVALGLSIWAEVLIFTGARSDHDTFKRLWGAVTYALLGLGGLACLIGM
jgi:hypothetical protein